MTKDLNQAGSVNYDLTGLAILRHPPQNDRAVYLLPPSQREVSFSLKMTEGVILSVACDP